MDTAFDTFLRERNTLLLGAYDHDALCAYMRKHGEESPPRELSEMVFHKARIAWTDCPADKREESLAWLKAHNQRSADGATHQRSADGATHQRSADGATHMGSL